jgi:homeobox protein cut-like
VRSSAEPPHSLVWGTPQELRRQFETISELRGEIKSLQADNLKLYEKVRYLQSYRDEAMPGTSKVHGGFQSTVRIDEELGKYQNKYEESMNPFEAFRGRVSFKVG